VLGIEIAQIHDVDGHVRQGSMDLSSRRFAPIRSRNAGGIGTGTSALATCARSWNQPPALRPRQLHD
jgi:hypothetical protein